MPVQWYVPTMLATIDAAGRLVIPKQLRDHVGLRPGPVEVVADGTGLRIEPLAGDELAELGGRLVIPGAGAQVDDSASGAGETSKREISDDLVRSLRDAGQR
jgi:AbrB family looped-hinge helix DNA binding protein